MSLPKVAIVGRVNVGKSSLFNRIVGRRQAIEDAEPGVTRDRLEAEVVWEGKRFKLFDTGGMGSDTDPFAPEIERQIRVAVSEAALVLFLVDVQQGRHPMDEKMARWLRTVDRPVMLVANKVDAPRVHSAGLGDFARLGLGDAIPVSAMTSQGKSDLLDLVITRLPADPEKELDTTARIAILGKRNVGKSTFVNSLFGAERVIVSPVPGTTRDTVDVEVIRGKRKFIVLDTAGLRKTAAVQNTIEFYAQARAFDAIDRCDVVLFLVDGREEISQVDRNLGRKIEESYKPAVLVLNKSDQLPKDKTDEFMKFVEDRLPGLGSAPVSFTSALKGENVWETVETALSLVRQAKVRWDDREIWKHVQEAAIRRSPKAARVYGARQVGVSPPHVEVKVNNPDFWDDQSKKTLKHYIQSHGPWTEVPIQVDFVRPANRKKNKRV